MMILNCWIVVNSIEFSVFQWKETSASVSYDIPEGNSWEGQVLELLKKEGLSGKDYGLQAPNKD